MIVEGATATQVVEPFDEMAWCTRLSLMAESANTSCGLSHDLYQARVSGSVDGAVERMPEAHRTRALEIAKKQVDYATPAQLEESARSNAEDGYCSHGIDRNCCPAGCGDLDDDNDWLGNMPFDWEEQSPTELTSGRWWPHCRGVQRRTGDK